MSVTHHAASSCFLRLFPMRSERRRQHLSAQHGLTLVELLVAISIMAFVAVLGCPKAWRRVDATGCIKVPSRRELDDAA